MHQFQKNNYYNINIEEDTWYASIKKKAINEIIIIEQELKKNKKKNNKKLISYIKNNIVQKNIFYSSYVSISI